MNKDRQSIESLFLSSGVREQEAVSRGVEAVIKSCPKLKVGPIGGGDHWESSQTQAEKRSEEISCTRFQPGRSLMMMSTGSSNAVEPLVQVDFEVFGRVQGVFFRKYTQDHARSLGLVGFCRNMASGTVTGTLQGPSSKVQEMKKWLTDVGSPHSKIDKTVFSNEKQVGSSELRKSFGIERTS